MNLKRKKKFVARTLGVGAGRVKLDPEMKEELKEAITRQDIKALTKEKIIHVKSKKGRGKKVKRKTKRRHGSKKRRVRTRKMDYVKLTRKLRNYVKDLRKNNKISKEKYHELRKKIKVGVFGDFAHLREFIREEK